MKCVILSIIFSFYLQSACAQDKRLDPEITIKWTPTALLLGNVSVQGEYGFGRKSSLTAKIGVPLEKKYSRRFNDQDIDLNMKAFSFMAGYRQYLSKQKLKGLYLEPYFKYVHNLTDGLGETTLDNEPVTLDFTNTYNAFGIGAQLGAQFIIAKRFVIDFFFLGPELNTATNNFRAIDSQGSDKWNNIEGRQAEADIKDFLNQFPFIKNRVDVRVDNENKTVNADFKGWVGGIRCGVSFGIAF
ncbi:MAG: DUF3575 domain-containing protein [Chitinophagaceae bacterium]|nr:DUF3575 domain-containing protein [Chitinophagaceae bacterium]